MTIGEIQAGIEITRHQDVEKAQTLESWLDQVIATYAVVPMDATIFREWARLMHRKSDTLMEDAMIAATASAHGFIVVTRNTRDFEALGSNSVNPFDPQNGAEIDIT